MSHRGSRNHALLDRRKWQAARTIAFENNRRNHGGVALRCELCGKFSLRFEVDHRVSLARGGAAYDPKNLQLICAYPCHAEKTARENTKSAAALQWRTAVAELR